MAAPHEEDAREDGTLKEGDYANLSEIHVMGSYTNYSQSGSFDDPSSLLDKHPYLPPRDRAETLVEDDGNDYDEVAFEYDSFSDSFSDTLSDDAYEEYAPPINQTRLRADTSIDIIGSLCLQGVMQGLVPSESPVQQRFVKKSSHTDILPTSILMTANLEGQQPALDELSVMVTRLEIVPESPYNPNAGTGRAKLSATAPQGQLPPSIRVLTHNDTVPSSPLNTASKVEVRPTSVRYINNIARAQPLPPLDESLPLNERKRYKVVESLLASEAGFLTSLNIAIELYKKPLRKDVHTELSQDDIKSLFGPVSSILEHHELFFAALSEQTRDWSPSKQIGNVFLASFNRKEVAKHYSKYVNNFTLAMSILEKAIKKKSKFVEFLKKQMTSSGCMLSLQALLLKPIQRFPQYLLFLQDLIKFTPTSHPDSVVLEMAEAHIEGVANYLNEAKRRSEQLTIIKFLNSKIEKLSTNLMTKNHTLHRQDVIKWAINKNGKWIYKERELLLFDHLLVCCSVKMKAKNVRKSLLIEADQVISGEGTPHLVYKWGCPVNHVEIIDPDYMKEMSPLVIGESDEMNAELMFKYKELKDEMAMLSQDFELLYKIGGLTATLSKPYEALNVESIQNSCRVLQRKLEESQELIRSCCEPCRVDITIPTSDGARYHQILIFPSKGVRHAWIRTLQLAKLRLSPSNLHTWVTDEEDGEDVDGGLEEEEELPVKVEVNTSYSESLPLLVDSMRLTHNSEISTVECGVSVGNSRVWFATGNSHSAFISVIRCFTPSPLLIETFPVSSKKILSMKVIQTTYSNNESSALTVWAGSQCGKLLLYDASSHKCIQSVQLRDAILCIEKFKNRAFVGLASGHVYVYTRSKGNHWNVSQPDHQIPVSTYSIKCFCAVDNKLWMGVHKSCVILNMETLHLEANVKVSNDDNTCVKKMEKAGAGVWVALNRGSILFLFHKDTRKPIQEINVKGSLLNIIAGNTTANDKFGSLNSLYITSLLAKAGYFWIGLSNGAILIYRIPPLNGLPLLSSRPFLASYGHNGTVRALVAVQTRVDNSLARFDQFMLDEKERNIGQYISNNEIRGIGEGEESVPKPVPVNKTPPDEVDESSLPHVKQVIKKLELGKKLLQSPKSLPRPIPKPRTKKLKKKMKSDSVLPKSTPSPLIDPSITPTALDENIPSTNESVPAVIVSPVSPPPALGGGKEPADYETPLSPPPPPSLARDYETPLSPPPPPGPLPLSRDYETPIERPRDSSPIYTEVTSEVTSELMTYKEEEGEEETGGLLPRTSSDVGLITPSRYQGNIILSGDSIYERIRATTITMAIPGREVMPTLSSTYVFTGGSGLINFRPSDQSTNCSNFSPIEDQPCVMTFQVP